MTASIADGLRAAARHPKLVLLIWAWYGLLALVPAVPAWTWWSAALGYSPEAASVLERFGLGVFLDLTRSQGVSGMGMLMAVTAAMAVVALVSSAFVFGGVLEVFGSDDDRRSFMHRFYRGGGHFFWRFVRLAVTAGICLVLVTGAVSAIMGAVTKAMSGSEWEPAGYLAGLAHAVVVMLTAAFFLLALDYARIRVARDDSRSMLRAYVGGLGFVLRRLFAAYGIAIAILAALAVLVAAYLAYETNAPAAGNWWGIAVLLLVQQAVVFGRVFCRVALVGAERHYYVTSLPKPVPAVVTPAATMEAAMTDVVMTEAEAAPSAPASPGPAGDEPEQTPT